MIKLINRTPDQIYLRCIFKDVCAGLNQTYTFSSLATPAVGDRTHFPPRLITPGRFVLTDFIFNTISCVLNISRLREWDLLMPTSSLQLLGLGLGYFSNEKYRRGSSTGLCSSRSKIMDQKCRLQRPLCGHRGHRNSNCDASTTQCFDRSRHLTYRSYNIECAKTFRRRTIG